MSLKGQCKESHTDQLADYSGELQLAKFADGQEIVSAYVSRFGTPEWQNDFEDSITKHTKYFPPDSIILSATKGDFKTGAVRLYGYSERCGDIDCKYQINFDSECELIVSHVDASSDDDS